ncbi:ubiquitin-specific protease doa4 [Elasticomyces elasticus]|nr:ubiquitin-specific protease doa4 [Elasticomyces elasticus]
MSAGGPLPPLQSGSPPKTTTSYDGSHKSERTIDASGGRKVRPMEHIKDLTAKAVIGIGKEHPIDTLLKTAETAAKQAQTLLDFRRPDLAYVEYIRASEIVLNTIPQHPDVYELRNGRGDRHRLYQALQKQIGAQQDQFENIKNIIVNDNKRNGTQPMGSGDVAAMGPPRVAVRDSIHTTEDLGNGLPAAVQVPPPRTNGSMQPTSVPRRPINGSSESLSIRSEDTSRPKPPISPKPQALHGKTIAPALSQSNGSPGPASADALRSRFAGLRMLPETINTSNARHVDSRVSQASSINGSPVTMPSPKDYDGRNSFDSLTRVTSASSLSSGAGRLAGSRMVPIGGHIGIASNAPFDAQFVAAMPKPPSPTYSPARNMQTQGNIQPPRSTVRSMNGTGGKRNSMASSASSQAPGLGDRDGYFPRPATNGAPPGPLLRRKSINLPVETRIGAEKLYDYLKMHNVLLIDVRSRGTFDQGHIYARSVMCIEPLMLRRDMSAEELQDSLVLSPDLEQGMFCQRHKYDLVVFYDQATDSDRFLHRPSNDNDLTLRYLHDALYEYNQEKPLQRPPILLMGGIQAWADLVGDQALMPSSTVLKASVPGAVRRVPVPNGRRLNVRKRPQRDYNPLDPEEETAWLERARVESVAIDQQPPIDEEDESSQVEDATPFAWSVEEFRRRYPEAPELEHDYTQHQASHLPPTPIPHYPRAPPPSVIPAIPSRPAPALPRISYSGVGDRGASQTKAPSCPPLPAYISSYRSNIRLPRTGLLNFGQTCYMNSTIQALSATIPLSMFFQDDRFHALVQRENWKGSKGLMPELYANLIRSLWKGDVESIKPSSFRKFCARLNREWGLDRQQDAKEFFDFLVDCLHEDLNSEWSRPPLRALTAQEEAERERKPKRVVAKEEWSKYIYRERSYLTSLFAGQHASRLRCTTCHFTSTTYEAFYSISVEIPSANRHIDIHDCLRSYCAEERLSGDEVWKCPHCNKEREATKQIIITRAPLFLVVHFKRFSASHAQSARKVRTPINFPLTNLDLEPYMLPAPTLAETKEIEAYHGREFLAPDPSMTGPYRYDAYAVMRHIGQTLTSGHYVCASKDAGRGCWRMFNDTRVADFDPSSLNEANSLQNEQAYIVFFQRREEGRK